MVTRQLFSILLLLISTVLLGFSKSALRAEGFVEGFTGPIEVFVYVHNNRISENEFRRGLLTADIENYIVHRKRLDSIHDANALVLLLDEWKSVYSAPLQRELAALYQQVATLNKASAIATYVLKLGNSEEFLVVAYNVLSYPPEFGH